MDENKVAQPSLSQGSRRVIVFEELISVGHLHKTTVGVVDLVGTVVRLRGTDWTWGWSSRWGSGHGRRSSAVEGRSWCGRVVV
ncbi:hypothetical protein F511_16769 [Dorcoceras hygrometricum]|uniref:Uncharacterized protein n=1 Tax=Dorcoceras hygrometricum TaxID=472368 RepID=A0A2Z7B7S8_9LAMI|nr:hypothetical protein F511_16769 [Dorcoceras hygrometricum]